MYKKMPQKDKFDEMMVDAGSYLFDFQMLLSRFVCEILEEFDGYSCDLNISIPFQDGERFTSLISERIFLDTDDFNIKITTSDRNHNVEWNELSITAQDLLADCLHMQYKAKKIYQSLSNEEEMH